MGKRQKSFACAPPRQRSRARPAIQPTSQPPVTLRTTQGLLDTYSSILLVGPIPTSLDSQASALPVEVADQHGVAAVRAFTYPHLNSNLPPCLLTN